MIETTILSVQKTVFKGKNGEPDKTIVSRHNQSWFYHLQNGLFDNAQRGHRLKFKTICNIHALGCIPNSFSERGSDSIYRQ